MQGVLRSRLNRATEDGRWDRISVILGPNSAPLGFYWWFKTVIELLVCGLCYQLSESFSSKFRMLERHTFFALDLILTTNCGEPLQPRPALFLHRHLLRRSCFKTARALPKQWAPALISTQSLLLHSAPLSSIERINKQFLLRKTQVSLLLCGGFICIVFFVHRYHLPILLLRYKGVAFAEKYMHGSAVSENYTLTSTQCSWVYTQALMDFKVGTYSCVALHFVRFSAAGTVNVCREFPCAALQATSVLLFNARLLASALNSVSAT